LFVLRFGWHDLSFPQPCHPAAKVLFDGLAQPGMRMEKHISQEVDSARINREHLVVLFDFQLQVVMQVFSHIDKKMMQPILVVR